MVYDPLLVTTIFLLIIAFVATFLFYGRIKGARQEYEKAKNAVEDVVISFDRQIEGQEQKLGALAYKTEGLFSRSDTLKEKLAEHKVQMKDFAVKVEDCFTQIGGVDKEVKDIVALQKKMADRIEEMEKLKLAAPTEATAEVAFPIRRDKALATLTETELKVLEILAKEGGKTSPEIKDLIKLAREHTARLMKKLYEEGYIERDTQKLPYRYRIKDEMLVLLKKAETKT